jgi:hypothetical protein
VSLSFTLAKTPVTDTSDRTAVGVGLMHVVDNPEIITVGKIPVSLWMIDDRMIDDLDDPTTDDAPKRVIRICTQGQDLQGGSNPITYLLKSDRGSRHELDLSIYGTPPGSKDDDIITEKGETGSAHANIDNVEPFGCYTATLPDSTASHHAMRAKTNPGRAKKTVGKTKCNVYVYIKMDMASVEIFAVYALDGGEIAKLAKTPFDEVFEDGKLREKWQKCRKQDIQFVQLRQVARKRPPSFRPDPSQTPIDSPSSGRGGRSNTIEVRIGKRGASTSTEKSNKRSTRPAPERHVSLEL